MADRHLVKSRRLSDGRWLTWLVTEQAPAPGDGSVIICEVAGGRLDGVPITDERLTQILLAVA
jgi:hypothetical protein